MRVALINERTHQPLAAAVEIAATRTTRRRGLLGRDGLAPSAAMLLAPCAAVHTAGMRFPIDVVFVDRQGFAVKVVRDMKPWRIAIAPAGRAVFELAAGTLRWGQVMLGDRLYLAPARSEETAELATTAEKDAPQKAFSSVSGSSEIRQRAPLDIARRLRGTAGTSVLEAAIITPLLLLLTLSIVDFGALFYVYLALENGVSQATRFGVTGQVLDDPAHPGTNLSRDASLKLAMRQATPTLTIPDSAFTFSNMPSGTTTWAGGSGGPNALSRISVAYTWRFINPMLWAFFPGGQVTLNVESAMKNEGAPPS
jgi:uncharacterized membrane protein (UPF0127 family)